MARKILPTEQYIEGIRHGDRVLLAQAITLVESARAEHRQRAREVIAGLMQLAENQNKTSFRVGITGVPGVGKSTFIESLGMQLIQQGHQVAVLAIDPSSRVSGGSILGDKTRMEQLSSQSNAFIRPSPSGEELGGVARKTRETILLVEAAGFDVVLVETVGVGQSETAVRSMTDLFMLLLLPGAGDELQGIKRGIVEMADLLVVNKADGDRIALARQAQAHYRNATHLLPPKSNGWSPKTLVCSALQNVGIVEVWQTALDFQQKNLDNGWWQANRQQQAREWMLDAIRQDLNDAFFGNEQVKQFLQAAEPLVLSGKTSPFEAAAQALRIFLEEISK